MKPAVEKGRMEGLDSLRGIAAGGVCLYHCCFASEMMPQHGYLSHLAQYGDKGVQVFFILSGFVIPYSLSRRPYGHGAAGRFLLRRFARIQPAYWVAVLFTVLIYGVVLGRPEFFDRGDIAVNAFYLVPFTNSPWLLNISWTLGVEAQFYILVALGYPVLTSESPIVRRLAFAFFVLLCFLIRILPEGINPWYVLPTWVPFFATGLLLFLFRFDKISLNEFLITATCMVALLLFEYTKLFTLVAVGTGCLVLALPRGRKLPGHFLGKISYSLYLVHLPVIIVLASWLEPLNLVKEHPDFSVVVLFSASVIASLPFYYFAEKPSHAWSRRLRG